MVNVERMTPGKHLRPTSDEAVANLKSSMKENRSNYMGTQLHGIANVPSSEFDKEKVGYRGRVCAFSSCGGGYQSYSCRIRLESCIKCWT